MNTALKAEEIYGLVASDLVRVEEELHSYSRSRIGPISDISSYLIDAGGKRVRPALLLLTARMLGEVTPSTIRMGAVVELIHNATLVHDDVIDNSDMRRGRPSANARWGNPMTVLAGDWLYMQSFAVALAERRFDVLSTLIDITQRMVEGELAQLSEVGRSDVGKDAILGIAESKTAALFSGCLRLPALLNGSDLSEAGKFAGAGRDLGMAFQLVDDLLDLTSTRETLGKPVASDLKEGKVTLPVFFALETGDAAVRMKVDMVLEERAFDSVSSGEILELIGRAGGVEKTRRLAAEHATSATRFLETAPPSIYRDAMLSIPDFILNRPA
jgi:octaprenyl-diphosphate synthase